jgi:hypothetical protein
VGGTLTAQTCGADSCTVTAPSNGTLGSCPSALSSGNSCQLGCNSGYTLSGAATSCLDGVLTAAQTCVPNSCTVPNPVFGSLGTCGTILPSGATCQIQCLPDYVRTGADTSCLDGTLTMQTCTPTPCNVSPPVNGTLGNCPGSLASGATCQFACSAGYTLTGASTSCSFGVLESQTCSP